MVVDRRGDKSVYAPGSNRAEIQAELGRHNFIRAGDYESTALPVQVEVEQAPNKSTDATAQQRGVACVTETPGSAVLENMLYERIWGLTTSQIPAKVVEVET